jgi:hypothetical protein
MAGYKKVTRDEAEIFMKLYRKYMMLMADYMEENLKYLPTDVINRAFSDKKFFDEGFDPADIDKTEFGFAGLAGYSVVKDVGWELNYCMERMRAGDLVDVMKRFGHKVNLKEIGVPEQ